MTQINLLVRVGLASTLWLSLGSCSSSCVQAFGARLVRPWELETKFTSMISSATIHNPSWTALSRKTTHQKRLVRIQTQSNDNDPGVPQEENQKEIISSSSSSSSSAESLSTTPPSFSLATSSNASLAATTAVKNNPKNINGAAAAVAVPTVLSSIGPLWTLVRPSNFPGIVLFHMLGVHLALSASNKSLSYWSTLLQQPSMWLVLAALILTSSTSMVVNDYYDAKLGRDVDTDKALAAGKIPLATARRFLRYLYGVALVVTCALPGLSTRLAVLMGLLLTYFYTQSLKPVTWLKNVVCASLIALAPVTSGSAALHLVHANPAAAGWQVASVPALWRLTASLFCGILGREIMMDCNDVENDAKAHVQTLPVVHGRRFASVTALVATAGMALISLGGPAWQLARAVPTSNVSVVSAFQTILQTAPSVMRQMALAVTGSTMVLRRSWQVYRTEGNDPKVVDKAVDEGLIAVVVLLASFV